MKYATLNDAADAQNILDFDEGSTEIWYQRSNVFGRIGRDISIDAENLDQTHVLLGKVCEGDKDRMYGLLQGENWSPEGEANELIRSKGLGHTSMSMGDVIVVGNVTWVCAASGWDLVSPATTAKK